jgi:hypothetical protein
MMDRVRSKKSSVRSSQIYSGRIDERHSRGVGLITNKKTKKCLIGWKPVSDRIITARVHSKYTKLTIIVCYSPTEDAEVEEVL